MNTVETTGGTGKRKWNLPEPPKRRLREEFADWLRVKNYRPATISAYVADILDFVLFHGKRDPREMGAVEVQQFLTMLAVKRNGPTGDCALVYESARMRFLDAHRPEREETEATPAKRHGAQEMPTAAEMDL